MILVKIGLPASGKTTFSADISTYDKIPLGKSNLLAKLIAYIWSPDATALEAWHLAHKS